MARDEGFRLEIDRNELRKMEQALRQVPKACKNGMARAVNRTLSTANTELQKAIRERYVVKKKELTKHTIKKKAKPDDLSSYIKLRGERMKLNTINKTVSPDKPKSHKGKTMAQIKNMPPANATVIIGQSTPFPHSFIAKARGTTEKGKNFYGLFTRVGKAAHPIEMQVGLSVANMVNHEDIRQKVQEAANEALTKNVDHEIRYRLGRLNR